MSEDDDDDVEGENRRNDDNDDMDDYDSEEDEDYDDRPKKKKKRSAVSRFIVEEAGKRLVYALMTDEEKLCCQNNVLCAMTCELCSRTTL